MRIDYFFMGDNLLDGVKPAFALEDVTGFDHCPVDIDLVIENGSEAS